MVKKLVLNNYLIIISQNRIIVLVLYVIVVEHIINHIINNLFEEAVQLCFCYISY